MCSKRHPVVLMPASTPHTSRCISLLLRTLCLCILQSLGVLTLLLNLIQKDCSVKLVKLHVMLLYFLCMLCYVASCMLHDISTFQSPQEPSGALRNTFPGPKCAAMKGCLSTTGAKFEFHQFHPSNVALYASYHLCVLM